MLGPRGLHDGSVQAERMVEIAFTSSIAHENPFVDVDVDVEFESAGSLWNVPAFWDGEDTWVVRFAPPEPGSFSYRTTCTDPADTGLHGQSGRVDVLPYTGANRVLRDGALVVSEDRRHLSYANGDPFFWLGDTWYSGFSDRIPWEGFQRLVRDRAAKGFTVAQIAVMTVTNEEDAPLDPGFSNEGGSVWDSDYTSLNPEYFRFVDRRLEYVVEHEIVPVLFGAWRSSLDDLGLPLMLRYWRYLIARYGAYPVVWIAGGEVRDEEQEIDLGFNTTHARGWTEVVRYIRENDPHGRLLSVHESPPALDTAIADETLTDFDFFQPSHFGWASIPGMIAQLNMHYSRIATRKPLIVAEIGWEGLGGDHLEDFQRAAFWLAQLNGAAGFSYGNAMIAEAYDTSKPLHRQRYSLVTWEEAMSFPSSDQLSWSARAIRELDWEHFAPHPEWVWPRGTTLLEPQESSNEFDLDFMISTFRPGTRYPSDTSLPAGRWAAQDGTFRLPYAAGSPNGSRVIYLPVRGFTAAFVGPLATVLGLPPDAAFRAEYYEPTLGVRFDLGTVVGGRTGDLLAELSDEWQRDGDLLIAPELARRDVAVHVVLTEPSRDVEVDVRHRGPDDCLAVVFSAADGVLSIEERRGAESRTLWAGPPSTALGPCLGMDVEIRDGIAAASMTFAFGSIESPIVDVREGGGDGVALRGALDSVDDVTVRASVAVRADDDLDRVLRDAKGHLRGALDGKWEAYGRRKDLLLRAYRPPRPPFPQDWALMLRRCDGGREPHRD